MMNYYPFHLGDYATHTAHLEPMEDLAYRRMLDLYYRTEKPLPECKEEIARLIRMKPNVSEVGDILNEFFELTPDGWRQFRCDAELSRMQDRQTKARASAAASVAARSTSAQRPLNVRSTSVELPTPTPEPRTPIPQDEGPPEPTEPSGFAAFWDAWPKSPRKVARKTCALKWQRLKLSSQAQDILRHVEAMKQTKQWTTGYEPAPITYLNGERWMDGLPEEAATTSDGYI